MAAAQSSGGAETGSTAALCGAIAGACNVVAGHPLDTCKVVLQASPGSHFRGTLHVASSLGFKGLYRGLPAPLLGGSLETSVNYTVYHACRRLLPPDLGAPAAACVAGGAAGVALSVVLSPLELVKCRVQAGVDASVTDAVRRVWLQGGPSGFTRGFGATLARELPGNALFFASYEALQRAAERAGIDNSGISAPLCGGLAGVAYWLAVLPVDMAKTRLQVASPGQPHGDWGVLAILRHEAATHGVKSWYTGAQPVIVRAFVANAAQWMAWDLALKFLAPQAQQHTGG